MFRGPVGCDAQVKIKGDFLRCVERNLARNIQNIGKALERCFWDPGGCRFQIYLDTWNPYSFEWQRVDGCPVGVTYQTSALWPIPPTCFVAAQDKETTGDYIWHIGGGYILSNSSNGQLGGPRARMWLVNVSQSSANGHRRGMCYWTLTPKIIP